MSRMKSVGEIEMLHQMGVRVPVMTSGVTAGTRSDQNETNTERGGTEKGKKMREREDIIRETGAAQRQQDLREAGEMQLKMRFV